jgi:hypothetical protein
MRKIAERYETELIETVRPYLRETFYSNNIPTSYVIDQFRRVVKEKCDRQWDDLKGILASKLVVYASQKNFERKENPLGSRDKIGKELGRDDDLYVVVPAFSSLTPAPSLESIKMAMNETLDERDQKRSVYSISKCPDSKEALLLHQAGLQWLSVVHDEVSDNSLKGYQWSRLTENHPDQRRKYIKYLSDNLSDTLSKDGKQLYFIEDTASKRTLLDCNDQLRMPFAVKGTADLMIIDYMAKQHRDVFAGLRLVVEVHRISILLFLSLS